MAIKRFVAIQNVGRMVSCSQRGSELNRFNLFFAENGRGKTTLCAVLRSLQTGEHGHISERKTIAAKDGEPVATIRIEGKLAQYKNQTWNTTLPELAIFDATFVAQNVHAGEYVTREHRTNLLQVIVGEGGVKLAKEVNELDGAIRGKISELAQAKRGVEAQIPKGVALHNFLRVPPDADVDAKIEIKRGRA